MNYMIASKISFVCISTILVSLFHQPDFGIMSLTGEREKVLINLFLYLSI